MKKIKRVLSAIIILTITILNCTPVMGYYTTGLGNSSGIAPSNSQFKSAKSKMYDTYSVCITGNISKAYGLEIFHYEAQESGYYVIYTMGSLDTVGKVYEEQNVLWSTEYKEVGSNNNGNYLNYGNNCAMVVKMDKGEDYYICVRAYGSKTGKYYLNIAPNEDKIISKNGGVWLMEGHRTSELNKGNYLCEKQYLTKEQVIFLYWSLLSVTKDDVKEMGYSVEILRNKYKNNVLDAIKYSNTITSLLIDNNVASITAEIITVIIEKEYANNNMTDDEMRTEVLEKICGADYDLKTGKWTAKCGLVAERWWKIASLNMYDYKYYGSNSTTLTGRLYYHGTWKK